MDTLEEQYMQDFTQGFNDAAILAVHAPELLSDIVQDNNPVNDYFSGFFAGKDHYQEEEITKEMNELASLRDKTQNRNNDYERE